MRHRLIVLLTALSLWLAVAAPADAIVYGTPDGNAHPNVGALLGSDGTYLYAICTGTLISQKRFLTAAHCIAALDEYGLSLYGVTFDSVLKNGLTVVRASSAAVYPGYSGSSTEDVAVVSLKTAANKTYPGITAASLPSLGALNALAPNGTGKVGGSLTIVGYGLTGYSPSKYGKQTTSTDMRMKGETQIVQLASALTGDALVQTSAGNGTGGGTCYGDSGGPFFLTGTSTVVAITITGTNPNCGGTDLSLRIDYAPVLSFVKSQL